MDENNSDRRITHPFLCDDPPQLGGQVLSLAAQGVPLRPVVVGADSLPALATAVQAREAGIAEPVLVGNTQRIHTLAEQQGWNIKGLPLIVADEEAQLMPASVAAVHAGTADSLLKGQVHTDIYMRGILARSSGLRQDGVRIVHVFAMLPNGGGRPLLISDAAVNVSPDLPTLQQSLIQSVRLAQKLGVTRPKVAVLSATESVLPSVPSSVLASQLVDWATDWAVQHDVEADFAGPLALDGAIAPQAAAIKQIDHPVAGHADIVIVPDIVSGNVLFKSLVWFAGAIAAGVVLGAKVPVVLTSRADPPAARLASVALAKLAQSA